MQACVYIAIAAPVVPAVLKNVSLTRTSAVLEVSIYVLFYSQIE